MTRLEVIIFILKNAIINIIYKFNAIKTEEIKHMKIIINKKITTNPRKK